MIGNCILSPLDLCWVEQVVVLKWYHILVELKHQWDSSWDVVLENFIFTHAGKMLNDGSQGISMGHHYHVLVVKNGWAYCIVPERQHSVHCDFKTLSAWKSICWQMLILWGKSWVSFVINIKWWWRDVVASSPLEHLLLTELGGGLRFVQALKVSIVALIKSPVLVMGDPSSIELISDGVVGLDRPLQH